MIYNGFESYTNNHCLVLKISASSSKYRTRYCNNLDFKCTKLFNIFPQYHSVNVDFFKTELHLFISRVPDELNSRQEKQIRATALISLIQPLLSIR